MSILQTETTQTKSEKVKKERWRAQYKGKDKPEEESEGLKRPEFSNRSAGDWIYGDDDFSTDPALANKQDASDKKIGI